MTKWSKRTMFGTIEKEKLALADRQNITAVDMDDGGFTDIMF